MGATYQPTQWLIPDNANTDKVGNYSFEFDGASDSIVIADLPALNAATTLTFSFWGKKATGDILGIEAFITNTNKVVLYWWSDDTVYWGVRNGGSPTSASSALADFSNWHHFAGTYNGSTGAIELYIDGSSVDTQTGAPAVTTDLSSNFVIGKSNGTSFGEGSISEVSIFNYALTSGEVTTLYGDATNGVGNPMGLASPPVAYYKGDRAALGAQWAVPNQVSQDYVFNFDGLLDYFNCGTDSSLKPTSAYSLSGWFKLDDVSLPIKTIISNDNNNGYMIWVSGIYIFLSLRHNVECLKIYYYTCCRHLVSFLYDLGFIYNYW